MDIVTHFENYCDAKGIKYKFGSKSHLNLIESNSALEPNKVHLLLFPPNRKSDPTTQGLSITSRTYTGNYFLVVPDDIDSEYEVKYEEKIKPLLTAFASMEKYLMTCGELDIVAHSNTDAIDVLDANLTGLWCSYQFRVYE